MTDGSGSEKHHDNAGSFEKFFEGWMVRQEHYLDELLSARQNCHESRDEDLRELISRILSHYQQYYDEKLRIAQRDILLVFSPTWFSTLERALLWIAGFKPAMAYQLVNNSVNDLSEDQTRRMNLLINQTRVEERALNDKLAKIQESIAAPPLVSVARNRGRLFDEGDNIESAAPLKSELESVLLSADLLRTKTAMKVVEILRPAQNVKFLAAATQLQLKIRSWGLQRKAERPHSSRGRWHLR